ncbi:MAG: NUDIX domain-containing protein [Chloroflexota bacterium]|jgi:predicted NUDIX family phosphoesterase
MTRQQEHVLVVPRTAVMGDGWLGVRSTGIRETLETIRREGRFEPRQTMENDPSFKQIIPYLVLRDGDRWFLMRRTRAGGDARLHDLWSIGIGGHLNPGDQDVDGGLRREWHEELVADFEPDYRVVGLLNDDTTSVGQVHLGVVCVADANGRHVDIRETEKLAGRFAMTAEVAAVRDAMESWSRLTFDAFVEATPANR